MDQNMTVRASEDKPVPTSTEAPLEGKAVPKLKLTFRLPTPPLSSSLPQQQEAQQSQQPTNGDVTKPAAKKARGPTAGTSKAAVSKKGPSKAGPTPAATQPSSAAPVPEAQQQPSTKLVIPVLEKREFPPQFAEQIQILKGLRAFKTRKWTARAATLKTISGASLVIPMWTREGDFAGEGQPGFVGSTSRRASVDGALETAAQAPTWVCPEESCRKVFDAKEKWRRHQAVHKKKLQLKLPNLSRIKEQQSQQQALPTSMADEPPTVLDSMPPSELGLSKLDSEL